MGKGDRKSRKGKIQHGSFGVRRPRKKNNAVINNTAKVIKLEKKPEIVEKPIASIKQEKIQDKTHDKEKITSKAKVKETTEPKAEPKTKKKKE